jgi:hypothetical protein
MEKVYWLLIILTIPHFFVADSHKKMCNATKYSCLLHLQHIVCIFSVRYMMAFNQNDLLYYPCTAISKSEKYKSICETLVEQNFPVPYPAQNPYSQKTANVLVKMIILMEGAYRVARKPQGRMKKFFINPAHGVKRPYLLYPCRNLHFPQQNDE